MSAGADHPSAARAISNGEVAARLGQLAELLNNEGANRYKVKAYRRAADAIRTYPERLAELIRRGEPLTQIPGVGEGISGAIREILESGTLAGIEERAKALPPGTAQIADEARISIRDAKGLIKELDIHTAAELRRKLDAGEIGPRLGERLEFKLRQSLHHLRSLPWADAYRYVDAFRDMIGDVPGVKRVEVAGSFRRGVETIDALHYVVDTLDRAALRRRLEAHAGLEPVEPQDSDRWAYRLAAGLLLVVRVSESSSWGNAMVEETGSAQHLREVLQVTGISDAASSASEEDWYRARGLQVIAPELREGRGEVRAGLDGALPALVELSDIKGDLHAHTTASDGVNTIEEMVQAARDRGYAYLAVTDHSKSLKITRGLDESRLRRQLAEIDRLNASLRGFRILKGSEVDILPDGSLDFGDDLLRELDVVMCSVHSRFNLSKADQTARLLRAIENPFLTCIGHLTGRLLLKRPGYDIDVDRVLDSVKQNGKLLEINSSPDRLDIDDVLARKARELGIPLLINTDAHSIRELDFMSLGVQQARRGWQSKDSVLNTLSTSQLLRRLRATRGR